MGGKMNDEAARLTALRRYGILHTAPESEFDQLADLARSIFAAPIAAISLIDEDHVSFKALCGMGSAPVPRHIAFCNAAIEGDDVLLVMDAHDDDRFQASPFVTGGPRVRSYMGAPLTTPDGYNIGTVCIVDTLPRDFSSFDCEVLATIAKIIITQMELRMLANEDRQTGATSRRAFMDRLAEELEQHKRSSQPSSLLFLNVDDFQAINNEHGQAVGDAVLRVAARAVLDATRRGDVLGRVGGADFGILLSDIGADKAMETAERIRQAIEAADVPDHPDLRVTASIGVAACAPGFETADDCLAAARSLMAEARTGGGNRAVAAAGRRLH